MPTLRSSSININSLNRSCRSTRSTRSRSAMMELSIDDRDKNSKRANKTTPIDYSEKDETFDYIDDQNENVYNPQTNLNKRDTQLNKSTKDQKKRKLDNLILDDELTNQSTNDSTDVRPANKKTKLLKDEFIYLFFEIQVTGFTSKDDIVKFCALQNPVNSIGGYIFPKRKRMINKMSELSKIEVGRRMMTDKDMMCNTVDLEKLLNQFVDLLESIENKNIVLVYENQFHHGFIPYILINQLKQFNLFTRVQSKVAGFIDCSLMFRVDTNTEFLLDLNAKNLKITSNLSSNNAFYRLDLLQKYFNEKLKTIGDKLDDSIDTFETVSADAIKYMKEEKEETDEQHASFDDDKENDENLTIEMIMEEANKILETKDHLTSNELLNLYLMQKHQYQYRNSCTYRPKRKAICKDEPKLKVVK